MLSVSSVTSVGKLFQKDGPVVAKLRGPNHVLLTYLLLIRKTSQRTCVTEPRIDKQVRTCVRSPELTNK